MRITQKGQVTIPVAQRRKYGLRENVEVEFVAEKNGLRIKKRETDGENPFRQLRGAGQKRVDVDRYIEKMRGR